MGVSPFAQMRVAARLANGFALDLVKLGGFGEDAMDRLLLAAITQANVAQITRSPELQRQFATLEAVPPDELRRPVSINAVATSLRIPFETARRRVAALARQDVVKAGPGGVIVTQSPLVSPLYRALAHANYDLVRGLYRRLSGIGLLKDLPRAPPEFTSSAPPVRLVIRLSSDYLLRLAEPVTLHMGDLVAGLILMDLVQANTEHLPDQEAPGDLTPEGFVRDELRRPARVATLSPRLSIPQETVRRRLAQLLAEDRCERTPEGYVVPSRVLSRAPFVQYMHDNQTHVQRLFQGLADLGVLTLWDLEAAELRGAA